MGGIGVCTTKCGWKARHILPYMIVFDRPYWIIEKGLLLVGSRCISI